MILSNYFKSFEKTAEIIPDWRKKSKNDLLNEYIDHEENKQLREAYMAAIMCRYWGAINKYYQASYKSATKEDCFEWLTHAIMYALKHRKWRDPNNKLYNDPKAPDKVVNRCIASTRHIYYQAMNNDNKKLNFGLESLENLEENDLSYLIPPAEESSDTMISNIFLKDIIKNKLNSSEDKMLEGLILDGIANGDVFTLDNEHISFNTKRLVKHLNHIDDKYCQILSDMYGVDSSKLSEISSYICKIPNYKLYKKIDSTLAFLRHETAPEDYLM